MRHLAVALEALALVVLPMRPPHLDALVPAETEPSQAGEDVCGVFSVLRSASVSSLRRMNVPPLCLANSQL